MRNTADVLKGCEAANKYEWLEAMHRVLNYFVACYQQMKEDNYKVALGEELMRDGFLKHYVQPKNNRRRLCEVQQMFFNPEVKELQSTANEKYLDIKIDNIFPINSLDYEVNQDEYLIFECKRLKNNEKNKLYIDEGLARFVKGEYAKYLFMSGMIGFIEEHKGIEKIAKDIRKRIDKLSDNRNNFEEYNTIPYCYHSRHSKDFAPYQEIEIFHLFLDYTRMIS
jgi:hypothetical protein